MKNIVISTDFSSSYTSTILYALKLMRGQKCNFWILNQSPINPYKHLSSEEMMKMECIHFEGLQRIQKLQKNLVHKFPEEDFNFRLLSIDKLQEQSWDISLAITTTAILKKWNWKMLVELATKRSFPLLLVPRDLEFRSPRKVLMSLDPNLEIKLASLDPFIKIFGNYTMDLEIFRILSDKINPALEARDEFELTQKFEAYHPKIRKIFSRHGERILKGNSLQKQIDLHIVPVVQNASNARFDSTDLYSSIAGSSIPVMLIKGSEKNQPAFVPGKSRSRTLTAFKP
ncbi:hypothetical protein [Salinimicrobium sp. HB62]|uniref:hypothetical protein n=1 Tax=Salinimicrobium sp. HB62 TaxID=3077781 RepID=UPI002D7A03CD|nr:hypothetical protein [Salinimicrobium sp. HB62]